MKKQPLIINQAVNMDTKVIFIAIPKTGTTTVRSQISKKGDPIIHNPHLNIMQVRDLMYVYLLKKTMGTNRKFPNEQMPDDHSLRVQAKTLFDDFFKFSAVRNPWARAVSMYFRREGVKTKENLTFEEFIDQHLYASDTCHQPTLHKNQFDWLCDENGNNLMNYIYKVEEFEQAIDEIRELTNGSIQLTYIEKNTNPGSQSRDYQNMYNDHTRKLIADRFEKDIDEFEYSF